MEQAAALLSALRGHKTVLVITHDPELIARCCTHVLRLEQGRAAEFYPLTAEHSGDFQTFFQLQNDPHQEVCSH